MKLIKWIKDAWNDQEEFVNDPTPYDAQIFEGEPGYIPPVPDEDDVYLFKEEAESEAETNNYNGLLGMGMHGLPATDQGSIYDWLSRGGGSEEGYVPHANEFRPKSYKK